MMAAKSHSARRPSRKKTGGRKAGTPNKVTADVKAALTRAFDGLGGVESLTRWAKQEPTEFYKLWAKLLPSELQAEVKVEQSGQIILTLPDNKREQ